MLAYKSHIAARDGFHLTPRTFDALSLSNSSIALLIDDSEKPFNNFSLFDVHFLSMKPPRLSSAVI